MFRLRRWFIEQVLPRVRAERPGTIFDVVGARPPQELTALAAADAGLRVIGYVPDVQPYLEQAGVFVVPLRADGGMRVKILEALARGLPLVTTTLGCEGIAAESGCHALIADDPQDFAQATLRILADRNLADELGRNGRKLIETRYDYRAACQPLEDVYRGEPCGAKL